MSKLTSIFRIALTVILATLLIGIVITALSDYADIDFSGDIRSINVRLSIDNINMTHIDKGSSRNVSLVVYNDGTIPMTLSMFSHNQTPPVIVDYIFLTWNRDGYVVQAGGNVSATLTLSVSEDLPSNVTTFSMIVTIVGSE